MRLYPTFRPGDPQSAQDKARMDKEYLSLMAELGEAPVPASVGSTSGPATTPLASAPRPAAPANNPPPPVSFRGGSHNLAPPPLLFPRDGSTWPGAWGRTGGHGRQHCSFGPSGMFGDLSVWEGLGLVSWSCGTAERTVLPPEGAGRDADGNALT